MQEQILVPRTLLDPHVRVGLKLEDLMGSQPPADEVGAHNLLFSCLFSCLFSEGASFFYMNLVPVKVMTVS